MTYIILPANEVQDQCKKLLEEIYNVRRYRDEIQIREQMLKKRRKWNLSPWYFTREQAIENLVKWSDFWGWRSQYRWREEFILKDILALAQQGKPVHVSTEHAPVLFR